MKELTFIQIEKDNVMHFEDFKNLVLPYFRELDAHNPENTAASEETILRYTQGMINMQGAHDRHLELCYQDDTLIGFHYAKVDHEGHKGFIKPGYGYIMEFYVVPEHRRKGYGRAMFNRLESLFAGHKVRKMYLTADQVTGEPFWKLLGFCFSGEVSPENKLHIMEKHVSASIEETGDEMKNQRVQVVIQTFDFPSDALIYKIAKCRYPERINEYIDWLNHYFRFAKLCNECFLVVAVDVGGEVLGLVTFERSKKDMGRWLLANLYVSRINRRKGIAELLIMTGLNKLGELKGNTVCAYVNIDNYPSLYLHKKLGFDEKVKMPFNELIITEDQVMLEKTIPSPISIKKLEEEQVRFITILMYEQAIIESLHCKKRTLSEWREAYKQWEADEMEEVYLIYFGCVPVGWLKLNGLDNKDKAWISMLVIGTKFQRMGIGRSTVKLAETYLSEKGFNSIGISTTEDNLAARNLYESCGYTVIEKSDCITDDGTAQRSYRFEKKMV